MTESRSSAEVSERVPSEPDRVASRAYERADEHLQWFYGAGAAAMGLHAAGLQSGGGRRGHSNDLEDAEDMTGAELKAALEQDRHFSPQHRHAVNRYRCIESALDALSREHRERLRLVYSPNPIHTRAMVMVMKRDEKGREKPSPEDRLLREFTIANGVVVLALATRTALARELTCDGATPMQIVEAIDALVDPHKGGGRRGEARLRKIRDAAVVLRDEALVAFDALVRPRLAELVKWEKARAAKEEEARYQALLEEKPLRHVRLRVKERS